MVEANSWNIYSDRLRCYDLLDPIRLNTQLVITDILFYISN